MEHGSNRGSDKHFDFWRFAETTQSRGHPTHHFPRPRYNPTLRRRLSRSVVSPPQTRIVALEFPTPNLVGSVSRVQDACHLRHPAQVQPLA